MFEFTKEEQTQITTKRKAFNGEKANVKAKDDSKKMFGKLFSKNKGSSARDSQNKTDNS